MKVEKCHKLVCLCDLYMWFVPVDFLSRRHPIQLSLAPFTDSPVLEHFSSLFHELPPNFFSFTNDSAVSRANYRLWIAAQVHNTSTEQAFDNSDEGKPPNLNNQLKPQRSAFNMALNVSGKENHWRECDMVFVA